MPHCAQAGFQTIVSLPIRLKDRLMGEVDLFYHAEFEPQPAERSLLEALTAHLAAAMENLRLNAWKRKPPSRRSDRCWRASCMTPSRSRWPS
jgi:two-component system nitrate/nitrite sensor histidine kinase NarX